MKAEAFYNLLIVHDRKKESEETLRYTLRSWAKFGAPEDVYIVGGMPYDWLRNIHFYGFPEADARGQSKYRNSFDKVIFGLLQMPKTPTIVSHNDIYLLREPAELNYYNGTLGERAKGTAGERKEIFDNTLELLLPSDKNYALHYPIWFNLERYSPYALWDEEKTYSWMNLVGALHEEIIDVEIEDNKCHGGALNYDTNKPAFSSSGETTEFFNHLESLYSETGKYER